MEGAPSGHFVPSAAAEGTRLEIVPLPSHSTLYLTVVDFSPASPPPLTVTAIARVRFLASMKRNPLAMSLDPKGVSE